MDVVRWLIMLLLLLLLLLLPRAAAVVVRIALLPPFLFGFGFSHHGVE